MYRREELVAQVPGAVVQFASRFAARWQMADQDHEAPPRQAPREECRQGLLVVPLEVRFDGLSVLRQEPVEASDSPRLIPRCLP